MPECFLCGASIPRGQGYRRTVQTGHSSGWYAGRTYSLSERTYHGTRTVCAECAKRLDASAGCAPVLAASVVVVGLVVWMVTPSPQVDPRERSAPAVTTPTTAPTGTVAAAGASRPVTAPPLFEGAGVASPDEVRRATELARVRLTLSAEHIRATADVEAAEARLVRLRQAKPPGDPERAQASLNAMHARNRLRSLEADWMAKDAALQEAKARVPGRPPP